MQKEFNIDGIIYVPKEASTVGPKEQPYVLIRTFSAGVHVGYLKRQQSTLAGIEVTLIKSRRLWYWDGAASLSQLAMEGVTQPDNCKFSVAVNEIELIAIEIIAVTEKAFLNIQSVKEWKK